MSLFVDNVTACCDDCGYYQAINETIVLERSIVSEVKNKAKEKGWKYINGDLLCPNCIELKKV